MSEFIKNVASFGAGEFPEVLLVRCDYVLESYSEEEFRRQGIEFPAELKRSVAKRQAEFLAGRYVAKEALTVAGVTVPHVGIGGGRSPLWPRGVSGSISHTDSSAVCAISLQEYYSCVGVDIEEVIGGVVAEEVAPIILTERDKDFLSGFEVSSPCLLTLAFSAKESLFKALYPSVGFYFGFEAACFCDLDIKNNTFTLSLTQDLSGRFRVGCTFPGVYWMDQGSIVTLVASS